MTRLLEALTVAWAAFSAAVLLLGGSWWHLVPLAIHLAFATFTLRDVRRAQRRQSHLLRFARLHLSAWAWSAVLLDRAARGAAGISHARLGLFRAVDLAHSEHARGWA